MNSSSSTMSFVLSQKGKPLLVMDDYVFRLNKITNTTKYYRCENRDCTATAHTDLNNVLLKVNANHSHVIEPEKKEIRIFKQIVKERATKESAPIPTIYEEESTKNDFKILDYCYFTVSKRDDSLNKARRLETPPIPDSQIFGIPYLYTRTIENEEFLCVDKFIKRKTRILLFASNEQLKVLFQNSIVLMDGTFSTCPKIFDQVFTIHSIKYEQSFICGIGLLPDRKKSTYRFVFEELKGFHNRLNLRVAKHHPNIWILIRCIQGEEIRFNHVLIQMIGGLTCRTKTAATNAIQQRIDTLYLRYQNNEITVDELLLGLSYVVAKNTSAKRKK
ncbi:unnamed protein product [Rotaria socialis]